MAKKPSSTAQPQQFVYDTEHTIYYSNREYVPISEMVKSLQSIEKIVSQTPSVINGLVGLDGIIKVEIYVSELKSGSLQNRFVLKYFFKDEKGFDDWVDKIRVKTGMDDGKKVIPAIVGGAIVAATLYGVTLALPKDSGPSVTSTVSGNSGTVINFIANELHVDAETVQKALEDGITNKKSLASAATDLVHPAKVDPQATITIDDNDSLVINTKTVEVTPEQYETPKPEQKSDEYKGKLLQIRATDRDSTSSGWRAVVPGLHENRVKLSFDEDINNQDDLANYAAVLADFDVISTYVQSKNEYVIKEIYLKDWERIDK